MHARCKTNKEGEKVDVVEQGKAGAVDERGRGVGNGKGVERDSRHR